MFMVKVLSNFSLILLDFSLKNGLVQIQIPTIFNFFFNFFMKFTDLSRLQFLFFE